MKYNLNAFHTFHLNVNANKIVECHTERELLEQWRVAKHTNQPVLLLGEGSNVLFITDFMGVVLLNRLKGIRYKEDEQFHYIAISAGENWHSIVEWALQRNIAGLENLALIPGCIGSAPIQNIGAYGVEFEQVCDFVEIMNLANGEKLRLSCEQCQFGYRESIFKHQYRENFVIITVGLKLQKKWRPILTYGTLSQLDPTIVTPQQIFSEVCKMRKMKLPDPNQFGNAGSFFKNPVVDIAKFNALRTVYPNMPHYVQADDHIKIPAGWLIEQCGLKGFSIGGAMVDRVQALVLINYDNATGEEILQLAQYVRQKVRQQFAIELHPEVRFIAMAGEINSEEATR